ncbi:MAG: hypothetical protein P4L50_29060 [Anaerolineaceae bacterium]|nr:hypothetical protein [Anaerolineaceae bacterium]
MHWSLGFALLFAAVVVWMYSSLRAEISSIVEMLKRVIDAKGTREHEQITDVATGNEQLGDDFDSRIRKQVYQDCPRYGIQDAYTIAELTRSYERENSRGRIRLLRRVYRQGVRLSYELALKAVMDSDSSVREWMARKAQDLDYSERQYHTAQAETPPTTQDSGRETSTSTDTVTHLYPERNLIERLKQDSDPFVRAALYENHYLSTEFGMSAFGDGGVGVFRECAPLERLAMMRNKELSLELVKRILDPQDTTLCLENEERAVLAKACMVNPKVVRNGRLSREMFPAGADGWRNYTIRKDSEAIWELAAKWPESSGVQGLAFKYVQTEDSVKSGVFQRCKNVYLRRFILESCLPEDEGTLKLGRGDSDPTARYIAFGRTRSMKRQEIEDALQREKKEGEEWVADGLLKNPWLGSIASELQKAVDEVPGQSLPADGAMSPNEAD